MIDYLPRFLAMAQARPEYQEFLELVNPENVEIRAALWGHFFPENTDTRNPVTFEFKVSCIFLVLLFIILFLGFSIVDGFAFELFR